MKRLKRLKKLKKPIQSQANIQDKIKKDLEQLKHSSDILCVLCGNKLYGQINY